MSDQPANNDKPKLPSSDGQGGTATIKEPKRTIENSNPNLVVEVGDVRNRMIVVNTFQQMFRGAFSIPRLIAATHREVGTNMQAMPDIPGQRFAIYMNLKQIRVFDPLEEMPDRMLQINVAGVKAKRRDTSADWTPIDAVVHDVDDDTIKTFLLEIHDHIKKTEPSMKVVSGGLPDLDQIEKLPGDKLNDPWNTNPRKPKYTKQLRDWENIQSELHRQHG